MWSVEIIILSYLQQEKFRFELIEEICINSENQVADDTTEGREYNQGPAPMYIRPGSSKENAN